MVSNVKSSWWFSNLVAPHMLERGSGNIILVSSIGAFRSTSVLGAYGISKAAEAQLARNLASELGPGGIRVNAIAPGLVKTDFAKALWSNPQLLKSVEMRAPLRRIGQPLILPESPYSWLRRPPALSRPAHRRWRVIVGRLSETAELQGRHGVREPMFRSRSAPMDSCACSLIAAR